MAYNKLDNNISHQIISLLNEAQQEAVLAKDGPVLVLAGPGSGKTKVITHRVAYLISQGVNPERILVLTFTNNAANEMKQRVKKLLNKEDINIPMGTIHSFGAKILRKVAPLFDRSKNFSIYDDEDSKNILKRILKNGSFNNIDPDLRLTIYAIEHIKYNYYELSYEKLFNINDDIINEDYIKIYIEYENTLKNNNAFDFNDLIIKPLYLFKFNDNIRETFEEKFDYILIDEFQDTDKLQLELFLLLRINNNNIFVVGDEDQSIYAFRRAHPKNLFLFVEHFKNQVKIIDLKYNYRSQANIVEVSKALIVNNKERFDKQLIPIKDKSKSVFVIQNVSEKEACNFIIKKIEEIKKKNNLRYSDFAVFYRSNRISRVLEMYFKGIIPYQIYGSIEFYKRKEIKDILAFLKILVNPSDDESFIRVLTNIYNGVGEKTLEKLILTKNKYKRSNLKDTLFFTIENNIEFGRTKNSLKKIYENLNIIEKKYKELSLKEFIYFLYDNLNYTKRIIDTYNKITNPYYNKEENIDKYNDEKLMDIYGNIIELKNDILSSNVESLEEYLQMVSLQTNKENKNEDSVKFMTLHLSKGLEFHSVFIFGVENEVIPHKLALAGSKEKDNGPIAEERRLLYVGITRAKENLFLIVRNKKETYCEPSNNQETHEISMFINEIKNNLKDKSIFIITDLNSIENKDNDDDNNNNNYPINVDQDVFHNIFGKGKIIKVYGDPSSPTLEIKFQRYGIKKIKYNTNNISLL